MMQNNSFGKYRREDDTIGWWLFDDTGWFTVWYRREDDTKHRRKETGSSRGGDSRQVVLVSFNFNLRWSFNFDWFDLICHSHGDDGDDEGYDGHDIN